MDKVYLVWKGEYSDRRVVFSSLDKTKAENISTIMDGYVEEFAMNIFIGAESWQNCHKFYFKLERDTLDTVEYSYDTAYEYLLGNESNVCICEDRIHRTHIDILVSLEIHPDVEKAYKIACDKLAKIKYRLQEDGIAKCIEMSFIDNFEW